jgi:hypothetical protein
LVVTLRPTTGDPGRATPNLVVLAEPAAPLLPAEAYVQRAPADRLDIAALADAKPVPPEKEASPFSSRPQFMTVSRHNTSANYGHASDYTWLQGMVQLDALGRMELHYGGEDKADIWNGFVRLEQDTRLQQLKAGDVIKVVGELVLETDPRTGQLPTDAPVYRMHEVWLLSR